MGRKIINSRPITGSGGKLFLLLLILLLATFTLTACDNGLFGNENGEDLRDQLPEWGVRDLVESYYSAIEDNDEEMLRSTLHPEEEIEVVLQFQDDKFYGENIDATYTISRDEYVKGYEEYFYYDINRIEKEKDLISIGDDEAEYVAQVNKILNNNDDFSYELTMNMELFENKWYIYSIVKEEE